MKSALGTRLEIGSISIGGASTPSAGDVGVDVQELMRDIFALSPADIDSHLAQAGLHVEVIHCAEVTNNNPVGHANPIVAQPYLNVRNDLELKVELDKLVAFSRDLSVHTAKTKNSLLHYQEYIELLMKISRLLPGEYHQRIQAFTYSDSTSRESLLASLSKAGLLPKEIIERVETHNAMNGPYRMSPAETLNYSVFMSYKEEFESLRNAGSIPPQSEKIDITNQELLDYTREIFAHALNALRKYLYSSHVWKSLELKYGEAMMKSFFMDYENLESGFLKRIYLPDQNMPTTLDYTLFYNSYIALVDRLNGFATTP